MSKGFIVKQGKLARRRLYKPERPPAHVNSGMTDHAPNGFPDATRWEVHSALNSICKQLGWRIGRGNYYDKANDVYHLTGQSVLDRKASDKTVGGEEVATLIRFFRMLNFGRKAEKGKSHLKRAMGYGEPEQDPGDEPVIVAPY